MKEKEAFKNWFPNEHMAVTSQMISSYLIDRGRKSISFPFSGADQLLRQLRSMCMHFAIYRALTTLSPQIILRILFIAVFIFISDFATRGFNFATRKSNLDTPVIGIVHVNKLKICLSPHANFTISSEK